MDPEYLEQLRAEADEIRQDLAEREARDLEDDDAIMAATRVVQKGGRPPFLGQLVYKTNDDAKVARRASFDDNYDDEPSPLFDDQQMDIVATVIAMVRTDMQNSIDDAVGPLRERIATLEGQVNMLMSLLAGDKTIEPIRKLQVLR